MLGLGAVSVVVVVSPQSITHWFAASPVVLTVKDYVVPWTPE